MIVDDVQRNLQILGGILAPRHFEVMLADSGEAALSRVAARRPDLILLDLMMPGMDGMEVCRRLKANPDHADIPVVFLSAANESKLAADAIRHGAVDYVTKPFNTGELLARVRTHIALKRTRDELHRIIAEKNQLMSAVAHDLKNPISAVRFSALMLRDQGLTSPDPRAELVDEIIASCEGVLEFIQQRLEASARVVALERVRLVPFDVVDALDVVEVENTPAAAKKGICIDVALPEEVPVRVQADPSALVRALNNLVSNAIKFSSGGSHVTLAVRLVQGDEAVRLEVLDQGPGLTEEDRQHLFTPYRRLSARPTAGESSTGLGLSIAHQLVEKMKGGIGCDPREGGGACFWIQLPRA